MTNTNTMAGRVKASEEAVPIAAHAASKGKCWVTIYNVYE
jgi:hypothetical protein